MRRNTAETVLQRPHGKNSPEGTSLRAVFVFNQSPWAIMASEIFLKAAMSLPAIRS